MNLFEAGYVIQLFLFKTEMGFAQFRGSPDSMPKGVRERNGGW